MTILTKAKPLRKAALRSPLPTKDQSDDDGYMMSDGEPMAESHEHQEAMNYAIFALRTRFQLQPDVYIMGNDFLHYKEGDRTAYISPDCYVVFGMTPKPPRQNFKIWEEGISPAVVFEMTSKETWRVDEGKKYLTYRDILKVSEYYRFDPKGEYLTPKLRGDFLINEEYQSVPLDANGRIFSPALGLEIGFIGTELRFYDPHTGVALLSPRETTLALEATERQLEIERKLRFQSEQEIERLRAEIAALKQG